MQAQELREILDRTGMTHAQLGELVGLSRVSIGTMARGQSPIEKRTALAIRYVLEHPDHNEPD